MGYGDQDPATFADRVNQVIDDSVARDSTETGGRFTGAARPISTSGSSPSRDRLGHGLSTGFVEIDDT